MRRTQSVPKLLELHSEDCPGGPCICAKVETIDVSKALDWDQMPLRVGETKRLICRLDPAGRPRFDMDDGGGNHYHDAGRDFCPGKLVYQTNFAYFAA